MSLLCLLANQQELEVGMAPPASWLTVTEQARWATLSSEARRRSFLAGRWLARQCVRRWTGTNLLPVPLPGLLPGRSPDGDGAPGLAPDMLPALEVAPSGACQVTGSDAVFVSISHHGPHVACAVAGVPVGVDIEGPRARRRDYLALAETVHSAAQRDELAALPPPERERFFLQAWTLKEAWLKARQRGLDFALMRGLEFDEDGQGDVAVAIHGRLVLALAAEPVLPACIETEPAMRWRVYRTRRPAAV